MIHDKRDIYKKYYKFCESVWPSYLDFEEANPCEDCVLRDWCKRHGDDTWNVPDEEYDYLEAILMFFGYFADEDEKKDNEDSQEEMTYKNDWDNFVCDEDCETCSLKPELQYSREYILDNLDQFCKSVDMHDCFNNKCPMKPVCNRYVDYEWSDVNDFGIKQIQDKLIEIGCLEDKTEETEDSSSVATKGTLVIQHDEDGNIKDIFIEKNDELEDAEDSYESVDGPAHYDGTKCIEEMRKLFGDEAVRGFCACNWYKYIYRAGKKPGADAEQDRLKAEWYLNYLLENF